MEMEADCLNMAFSSLIKKKPYQKFRNYAKSNQDDNFCYNETWLSLLKFIFRVYAVLLNPPAALMA